MTRNDPRQPTVDMSPLEQAYKQEREATGMMDSQASSMDVISQYERDAARARAEQERAAKAAQAEQERAAKINVTVAKKRGVEVEIDPVTAQERIKRTETGAPVWTPGFTSGPTPAEDGTNAVKYRDPSGQEYQVPLDKINRREDPSGPVYEFEIPGADGQPQKIRRPEDASKPLFKVDKTTGQRFAEVLDPVTGGLVQQPLGMDPIAANAAAIAKRQEVYAQTSEQRKFQAEQLRLQQALEETDLSPIEQRRKELLAARRKTQTGTRYEETPDGVKAYSGPSDTIGMMIGGFPDQLEKAKAWLTEKKRVEQELAKVEVEYQPRAKKVQEMEQARARMALQALQDDHRTRQEIKLMEQAAKQGAPLWQTETQKRIEEAMKDPAISRIYTEGQMADEGNPMLQEVGKATRSPIFDAVAQFANRGMSATPDLSGIEAPSTMALTEMLAETAKPGKLMPGTPDIQSAAATIGITTPDEYDIEPANEGGTGAKLMHRATGEWIGTLDADKNRLNLWSHKATTDQGRAILANATPETAPVFIMGGGGLPMTPNERRDYLAQAMDAAYSRNEEQLTAIGADVAGIRRNVKEGRLSVQDGKKLLETLYGQKNRDLSTPAVAERLNQYAAASEIESGLWKGPKATPEGRAQVIDRFTDSEAQAAQGNVIYDGERLEALRGELKAIFAKKSTTAKIGDWFADTGKMLAGSITGLAVNLGLDVAEGTAEVATLGNYDSSERGELTAINTAEWFRNAAGFFNRATKGNQAFEQVTADLQSWAMTAEPGDTPPPDLASRVAETMFTTYHRFSDDEEAKARETSQDSFDPTKDPVTQKYLNRYLEYRNPADFAALKSMMVMDSKGRAIADRVNQYVTKPRSATPADVIDKAAVAGLKVNENQAQLMLDAVRAPIKDEKQAENIKRRIAQVMGFKNPDDALLAMDLFTGDAQYDPSSFIGYFRSGTQAPLQEIALEAASTFTGARFGQLAARGALGAVKNTTIAATRRAALGARAAAAAASLTDDYSRLGMFAARFGQPLTRMQRASNAVVSIGKGVAGDAVAEGIEEGVMAIGEPGSTPGSVLAQAAQGAAVAPVMVGGMATLALPFQIRNERRASRDWNKTKLAYLAKVNEQLAAIPGSQPFTPDEFEQAVTLFGSNAAIQGNQAVSAAFEQYKAAVAASPKLPDGSPVLSPQAIEARQNMAEAIATIQAREALVIDAAVELRDLPPDQRTLFTAVAKAQMGINEFTREEAQALARQQGANRLRFVPAPTNAAPTRLTGFDQLPAAVELPGRRVALAPGSVPVLPTALLAELSQSAPSLGELLGHPLSPVPAATAGQASPVAAQVAPTQDSGASGQGPATTATGVVDNPEGGVAAPPAVASPAPISQTPPAQEAAPAVTAPPEEVQRVTKIARQVISQTLAKSPKLKDIIAETKDAPAYQTGGMWMNADGTVAFHLPTLINQLQGLPNKQIGERVTALLDEEIRHTAQMQAARILWEKEGNGFDFETWRDAWYGDIWENQFTEEMRQKVIQAYGETLPQEPWIRAMEGLRMLDQLRATGSITEAVLRHLAEVLKYLAETIKDVTPAIQREMDAMRDILIEYGYEKGKGSNPKRAKTQVRKVDKTPPAALPENASIAPEITPQAVENEDSAVLTEVDTKLDAESANPEPSSAEIPVPEPIPAAAEVDIPADKSGASEAAKEKARAAFDGLASAPVPAAQSGLPQDRFPAFLDLASTLISEQVTTPEKLATFLQDVRPDGTLQKYSQAMWDFLGIVDPALRGTHDWTAVYDSLANPGPTNDTPTNDIPSSTNLERNQPDAGVADPSGTSGIQPGGGPAIEDGGSLDEGGGSGGNAEAGSVVPADVPSALGGGSGAAIVRPTESRDGGSTAGDPGRGGRINLDDAGVAVEQRGADAPATTLVPTVSTAQPLGQGGQGSAAVKQSAPALTDEQAGDVVFIEGRLAAKPGVLLTNGTGTGKTFSALGAVKRMLDAGAKDILVVAPSDKIVGDWIATANQFFGITDAVQLPDTKSNGAGARVVVTTYANLGQNNSLVERPWSAVVADEAHYLSQSKDGNRTEALDVFRALSLHRDGSYRYADMKHPDAVAALSAITERNRAGQPLNTDVADTARYRAILDAARADYMRRHEAAGEMGRPKAILLSATPFAYHFSLDYAEGYLFDFPPENTKTQGRYNHPSPRSQFYMENFGYRMRTGKLTQPENATATGILERRFAQKLMREGAMSGRALQVDQDYGRHFILTESVLGSKIDEIISAISSNENLRPLADFIGLGDYLARRYLLEALKARESISRIRKHLDLGRKVVVFHDYKKGGSSNPLRADFPPGMTVPTSIKGKWVNVNLTDALNDLRQAVPGYDQAVAQLDGLLSPLDLLTKAFPGMGVFNGDIERGKRREVVNAFNKSGGPMNIILVQRASGKEGISLHDRDGKQQRVFMDLGIPGRPTDAIQGEGRIYRHGVKSNAIIEYLTTGTSFERWTFAQTIAQRASTAENLAMGERARSLLQSFASGYMDAEPMPPSSVQGTGGKQKDTASQNSDPFADSVALYYTNTKKTSRNKAAEGVDYFPTPEPLGLKMVEWAGIRPGDKVLEPSAGHGAIARFFPDSTNRHAVEPSNELAGRLALNATDVQIHETRFEDYNTGNKFDAIVMNPPFGTAGKTAMDHVIKATKHLRAGGRIVALIPEGSSMEKRFDAWMESDDSKGIHMTAEYGLPSVAFERAGTSVKARVVILDKAGADGQAGQSRSRRDFNGESITEFFEAIKNSSAPDRAAPAARSDVTDSAEAPAARETVFAQPSVESPNTFQPAETWHAKNKKTVHVAKIAKRLERDAYNTALALAKKHGGYYSAFKGAGAIPGFQFDTVESRDAFMSEALKSPSLASAPAPTPSSAPAPASTPPADPERLKAALTKMPELWRNVLEASLNGTSIPEIAQANNLSEVAVGRVLEQANGRLNFLLNLSKDGKLRPTVQVEDGKVKASAGSPRQAMGGNPAFVAVDQRRTHPEEVTHAEMQDMAQRMFAVDPAAAEQLVTRWMDSGTTVLSVEGMPDSIRSLVADAQARQAAEMLMTAAAKLLVTEKSLAGGDAFEIARLIDLYRTTGTEQARALNMRYDPHQSPKERAAMFISEALLTPPESMRNEIRRNPANKERILKAWSEKAQALKEQLKAQGYDIDATFAALRAEQRAAEATVPQEVKVPLAQADSGTRSLVRGILEGQTWQDAAIAAKMSLEQARTAYNAFRTKINEAGAAAAKAARDTFLASAPAQDFASQVGLPEWTDDVDVTQTAVETEATRSLKRERTKAKPTGAVDLDNPVDTARLQNEISTAKSALFDKISEFWRASILSGPQTQVVNLFSGLAFGGYEATVKKIGAGAAADIARMFGMEPDAASLADLPAMLSATVPAVKQAFADAIKAWKAEASFFNSFALGGGRTDSMVKADMYSPALTGPVGKVMRGISFRLMLLADEFVKSFFTRIEVAAQARQIARSEGLRGEAMAQRISELLIPGSEAWVRGLDQALKVTFQTELGTQGGLVDQIDGAASLIQKAKKGDAGWAVKGLSHFVFPFVATPTNIFKMGLTMSPLGTFLGLVDAARSLNETRKGNTEEAARLYNATRLFDDMVNQIVAWGAVFVIAELVKPGEDEDSLPFVTGSLPWKATSQGEREVAYRTAPPTSIRIGDRWYSYARLDPFASSLVFVVDAVKEFQRDAPVDEAWGKVALQMFTAMQDKTFLQGFSDLMNAIQSPERFGTRFATNIATGFVPNLIRQPIRSADDLIRENDLPNDMGFWDVLSTRIGYSMVPQFAPPAVDVWGREQTKGTATGGPMTDTLLRLFSPVQSRAATGVDPLDVAILRYNMTADKPFGVTAPERELSKTVAGNTMKASLKDEDWLRLARDSGFAARVAIGNRYNGKDLSDDDIDTIKDIISRSQTAHRDREKRIAFGGASLNPQ